MKCIMVCFLALAAVALARPDEKYTDKYDNVNLDEILQNEQILLKNYKCMMDMGKCTPEMKELKSKMQESLETKCAKCTDAQKEGVEKVMGYLINFKPELWQELSKKYDPDNKYTTLYEKELKKLTA